LDEDDVGSTKYIVPLGVIASSKGVAASAATLIENDSDGSRGVDRHLRKKDFEGGGGTDEDAGGGVSELDDAGGGGVSDEEDVGGFLESSSIVKDFE
jgi:hypothetical protein